MEERLKYRMLSSEKCTGMLTVQIQKEDTTRHAHYKKISPKNYRIEAT